MKSGKTLLRFAALVLAAALCLSFPAAAEEEKDLTLEDLGVVDVEEIELEAPLIASPLPIDSRHEMDSSSTSLACTYKSAYPNTSINSWSDKKPMRGGLDSLFPFLRNFCSLKPLPTKITWICFSYAECLTASRMVS